MRSTNAVAVVDVLRSPLGQYGPGGTLAGIHPVDLLAQVGSALLRRSRLEPSEVSKVLIAGRAGRCGWGRAASDLMGLSARMVTVGQPGQPSQRVIHAAVREVGRDDVVMVLAAARDDVSPDTTTANIHQRGVAAELVGARWNLGRSDLDAYARRSWERARDVAAMGEFGAEIAPIIAPSTDVRAPISADQTIGATGHGRALGAGAGPLFYDDTVARGRPDVAWNLHAGNTGRPAYGAAGAILVGSDRALELGLQPRARLLCLAECPGAEDDEELGSIAATRAVLNATGLDPNELDHYEVDESFPSIPLAWQLEFDADAARLNPRGGALSLGEVGAASGLRSFATALSALEATGGRFGLQVSEGAGKAGDALVFERLRHPTTVGRVLGERDGLPA